MTRNLQQHDIQHELSHKGLLSGGALARGAMPNPQHLEKAIAYLESQRAQLGDAVVNAAVVPLRQNLAALSATPRGEQRKQVTILFADISGFTAMSENMDAEIVLDLVNALWERLDHIILQHGGIIDKHIGDALMALWGIDNASENDPERAVRAALQMLQEIVIWRRQNARRIGSRGEEEPIVSMRVGVHTGPALLGRVGTTREFTAIGDTVNTASRLEQAAPAGGIFISQTTQQLVRGLFDLQEMPPVQVKGKREPLTVYLVQRVRPHRFQPQQRGIEGIATHMVGRNAELARLQELFEQMVQRGERQMVTIVGEAGIGKSRLLYEFDGWVESRGWQTHYLKGRARQELQPIPYALLRETLSASWDIRENDSATVVRHKLERALSTALGPAHDAPMRAHFIGHLLGMNIGDSPYLQVVRHDAKQVRERALRYLVEFFQSVSHIEPTILLFEDIHWADDSSLRVLQHLATALPEQLLFILCSTRPSLLNRHPNCLAAQSFHHILHLTSLSDAECRRLIREILQDTTAIPKAFYEFVSRRAEGNPYHIEEFIKMLIQDGVITQDGARWHIHAEQLTLTRIPATLTSILQARLDGIGSEARTVLQCASIFGRTFWNHAVSYLIGQRTGNAQNVDPVLQSLVEQELIVRNDTSAFHGTDEYMFKHSILRDATYECILLKERGAYHAWAAQWLLAQRGEHARGIAGLVAEHLTRAGHAEEAVDYVYRAAVEAADSFAATEALAYMQRALDLLGPDKPEKRYAILLLREHIYDLQGNRPAQQQDITELAQLAQRLADLQKEVAVLLRRATFAHVTGDYTRALNAARAALDCAAKAQRPHGCATARLHMGRAWRYQGDFERAQPCLEEALAWASNNGAHSLQASCLYELGQIYALVGHMKRAHELFVQAQRIYQQGDDRRNASKVLDALGTIALELGDSQQAIRHFEASLGIKREIGDRHGEGMALYNVSNAFLQRGMYERAQTHAADALRIFRQIDNIRGEGLVACIFGALHRTVGAYAAARDAYQRAITLYRTIGERQAESKALADLGRVFGYLGNPDRAGDCCNRALILAQELGIPAFQAYALTNLGHALLQRQRADEAAEAFQQALVLRRALEQDHLQAELQAGLAAACLQQDDRAAARSRIQPLLEPDHFSALEQLGDPIPILVTCCTVLVRLCDPRYPSVLRTTYALLQQRAQQLPTDDLRAAYLHRVPEHRRVVEWIQEQGRLTAVSVQS